MLSPKPSFLGCGHCSFHVRRSPCTFRSVVTDSTAISPITGGSALAVLPMLLQPIPMYNLRQAAVPAFHHVSPAVAAKEKLRQKCVDPYEPDVDADLRAKERDSREHPDADYMSKMQQGHISPSMRAELVLWMDAFAGHLGGLPEGTLCRAVVYLDRVLSVRPVPAHDEALQLVAAAAVSLGAKYEQSSSGRRLDADVVEAFLGTTVHAVEAMECELVMDLCCLMDGPTAYTFVDHFTRFFGREDEFLVRSLALRLINLTLAFFGFVGRILPSAMAASALFLAKQILGVSVRDDLEEVSGYKEVDLMGCICDLEKLLPRGKQLRFCYIAGA